MRTSPSNSPQPSEVEEGIESIYEVESLENTAKEINVLLIDQFPLLNGGGTP